MQADIDARHDARLRARGLRRQCPWA
jgi:hypothetical protein